jgi:hypothetical protein
MPAREANKDSHRLNKNNIWTIEKISFSQSVLHPESVFVEKFRLGDAEVCRNVIILHGYDCSVADTKH